MSLSHFQEKAGVISCETEWGSWSQNCDEITIEVKLSGKYKSKELDISICTKTLCCKVRSDVIIEGQLFSCIHIDESMWSLEDGNLIRILLSKAKSSDVWPSLMADGRYAASPQVLMEMKKQADLELFQLQYPGMDFTQAKLDKCYDKLK